MHERHLAIVVPGDLGEGLVAVKAGSTLTVNLRLETLHEGILVSAQISGKAAGECGRCLIEIELPVQVEFHELFAYSLDEAYECEVQDDHVDLEPLIRDAVVLSLPFQPVCRSDCPGLDPETGQRLAEAPELEPVEKRDPRWAALMEFQASANIGTDEDIQAESDREEK
ncbi:DUF177 domain-containing protein [Cryobacterium algoritolerans]|uniref:DUF177 domain-containing protein n=2 Tax=Cryobacterium algoritolerans TaxID=1259184 RepID=A0A4R8WZ93_9MICO|nr:DUF177 domain-containing protein [Cryobacterium algoritolerans]